MGITTDKGAQTKLPKTVYIIFISLVLDLLAFTLILPLFPSLFDYYKQNDKGGLYHVLSEKLIFFQDLFGVPEEFNKVLFGGFLGSLFSLLQYFSSAFLGALSDVYGRKPLLLASMIGIALSYIIWAFSGSFALFVLARVVGGLSKANISLSTAVIADVCPPAIRNKGMALVGIAFSIGFIVGPCIGAGFATLANRQAPNFFVAPAMVAFALALLDLSFLSLSFQESLPPKSRASSIGHGLGSSFHYLNPKSLFNFQPVTGLSPSGLSYLQRIGLVYFLYLFLYSGLEFTLTFLTQSRFHYTRMQQAYTYIFSGIVMALFQGGYTRRIPPGKEGKIALKGLVLIVPAYLIMGIAFTSSLLYIGLGLYSISTALVVPCITTLASNCGSDDQKGKVLGVFRSLGALARALGPCIASSIFWCFGPTFCYTFGGLLLLIPCHLLNSLLQTPVKSQ